MGISTSIPSSTAAHQHGAASAGPDGIFDCKIGMDRWELGWSVLKRGWCCKHESIACGTYDCTEDLGHWQKLWSSTKKDYCCEKEKKGCSVKASPSSEAPFDCDLGTKTWQDDWSEAKKEWCCEHEQSGCPPQAIEPWHAEAKN